eukprot:scaffold107838_cov44-Prasinocladus_malaysianus.AAC.1
MFSRLPSNLKQYLTVVCRRRAVEIAVHGFHVSNVGHLAGRATPTMTAGTTTSKACCLRLQKAGSQPSGCHPHPPASHPRSGPA